MSNLCLKHKTINSDCLIHIVTWFTDVWAFHKWQQEEAHAGSSQDTIRCVYSVLHVYIIGKACVCVCKVINHTNTNSHPAFVNKQRTRIEVNQYSPFFKLPLSLRLSIINTTSDCKGLLYLHRLRSTTTTTSHNRTAWATNSHTFTYYTKYM